MRTIANDENGTKTTEFYLVFFFRFQLRPIKENGTYGKLYLCFHRRYRVLALLVGGSMTKKKQDQHYRVLPSLSFST